MAPAADWSNWMRGPWNQWSFQNVDEILKTRRIQKPETASHLERQLARFEDFRIDVGQSMDLPTFLSASHTDGLIVLHKGKIVFEEYLRQNDESSKHIVMSMTKSVTALVVGILQGQGVLNENDLVTEYVPEVSGTLFEKATIRTCLDMRSGAIYPDGDQEYRAAVGWNPEDGSEKHNDLLSFIANFHPQVTGDDRFEYVSVNTDLVGIVVERAAGQSFADIVRAVLWEPMGAESDALMTVDKNGNPRAAGGLCATLRDIARVGQLIVEDGKDIIPASWLQDIARGGDQEAWAKSSWARMLKSDFESLTYRSCFITDSDTEVVIAMGAYGQAMFVDRKHGIVVAKTASQTDALELDKVNMTSAAFREFRRLLTAG